MEVRRRGSRKSCAVKLSKFFGNGVDGIWYEVEVGQKKRRSKTI